MAGETAGQPDERRAALAPGSVVVGRYRLEKTISAGARETELPAHDELLDRDVAIRVIAAPPDADEQWRGRFVREIEIAARILHPSVVPVVDLFDGPDDTMFVVTPLVRGSTLSKVLAREGPLSAERAANIISAVASALDEVHRAGVVHRDVKPANILVEPRGGLPERVYLVDFGVAIFAEDLGEPGAVVGAPGYMPPEQIEGYSVDGRADQYALAVTAFSLLTGKLPFQRDHTLSMLHAHLSEPPPRATSLRSDLPPEIDAVLARALAKAPDERFSSAGEFAEALHTALMTSGPSPDSQLLAPRAEAGPALSDELLTTSDHQRDSTGPRSHDDRDDVPVGDQRTWDEALDGLPLAGSGGQSPHRGDMVSIGIPPGVARPPGVPDPPDTISRPYRRSLVQAFTDGLGGVFDIFSGIERQRWSLPAFEDTLGEDARALCLELGLISRSANGSREGTN